MSDGCRSEIELVLKANHLQVCNDQRSAVLVTSETRDEFARYWEGHSHEPLVARNHILASICPQVSTFYVDAFPPLTLNLLNDATCTMFMQLLKFGSKKDIMFPLSGRTNMILNILASYQLHSLHRFESYSCTSKRMQM